METRDFISGCCCLLVNLLVEYEKVTWLIVYFPADLNFALPSGLFAEAKAGAESKHIVYEMLKMLQLLLKVSPTTACILLFDVL